MILLSDEQEKALFDFVSKFGNKTVGLPISDLTDKERETLLLIRRFNRTIETALRFKADHE